MIYRRQASPMHAARAAAGLLWCAALLVAVLTITSPWPLLALTGAILTAGRLAGCAPALRRALLWGLLMAATICLINALVSRSGLTIVWRFGNLPIIGETNVTLQALVYGAMLGLKALALILVSALYSSAIDPDEVLRLMRRFSFRSALTASVATRMVPVLVRDSRRLADAQRCRLGRSPSRVQLLRATTSGVLDRALDVAAALEVRGYGAARQPPRMPSGLSWGRGGPRPWSRHDFAFTASAAALLAAVIIGRVVSAEPFQSSNRLHAPLTVSGSALCVVLVVLTLAPFTDRRGITG